MVLLQLRMINRTFSYRGRTSEKWALYELELSDFETWKFVILKAIISVTSELMESLWILFSLPYIFALVLPSLLVKGTMTKESGTLQEYHSSGELEKTCY